MAALETGNVTVEQPPPSPRPPPPPPKDPPALHQRAHSEAILPAGKEPKTSPTGTPGSGDEIRNEKELENAPTEDIRPVGEDAIPNDTPEAASDAAHPLLNLHELVNKSTRFLATAPPEQLIAISISGVVMMYVVFGRLSLLFVGMVAGAVGHASLGLMPHSKKGGGEYSEGIQEWIRSRKDSPVEKLVLKTSPTAKIDFSSLPPETEKALDELVDEILKDYVRWGNCHLRERAWLMATVFGTIHWCLPTTTSPTPVAMSSLLQSSRCTTAFLRGEALIR